MSLNWEQRAKMAEAELLRGSGVWPEQEYPCHLEPPCDQWDTMQPSAWTNWYAGWSDDAIELPAIYGTDDDEVSAAAFEYVPIVVEHFHEDDSTLAHAEQLLRTLTVKSHPFAFEIIGVGPQPMYEGCNNGREIMACRRQALAPVGWEQPSIKVQFAAHRRDATLLYHQLLTHFPNSGIILGDEITATDLISGNDLTANIGYGTSFALKSTYLTRLQEFRHLDADPLAVAIAAMEHLGRYEWAHVQILFTPVQNDWAYHLEQAVRHPYPHAAGNKKYIYDDITEREFRDKFASPLFAVSIRVAALKQPVYKHLLGWARQFAANDQALQPRAHDDLAGVGWSLMAHCTFTPGMLLNATELAGLVHIPSPTIHSDHLLRVQSRTRPLTVNSDDCGAITLGTNTHQGEQKVARIPAELRSRHCYIAGASGTGKSTLLLNCIMQDIAAGRGVGVLDPHGDLIKAVLPRIPANRVNDVVLFDPTDREYPFALNILSARDQDEQERIVDETIMALQRYFPASWGPRLERILTFAIKGVLDADPAATLADVERILVDDHFRLTLADRMCNVRYKRFWIDEFPKLGKAALDPVLNKLSVFIEKRIVRNIVCQRKCAVDFDEVLNDRRIFLANLSTGILNESVANILGSFLVTKIVNAAFRRAGLPPERRIPWYLYIDEFQNFMGVSVGFERILAEARKYNLCLAGLANQYIGQLSPTVRQAIFGNIGVMVMFRLGVEDANIAAREMGAFTAEEILSLELGEAFARTGGSKTAFNLKTYADPPLSEVDLTPTILERMHTEFAKSRELVEKELHADGEAIVAPEPSDSTALRFRTNKRQASEKKEGKRSKTIAAKDAMPREPPFAPTDPNEDDLIS